MSYRHEVAAETEQCRASGWAGGLAALLAASILRATSAQAADSLALDAPIPDSVPPGTSLVVGAPTYGLVLKLSGELEKLPFKLEVVNVGGCPDTINAFHAKAIDVGSSADIPPIEAEFLGLDIKVVAISERKDQTTPSYQFGIAPSARLDSLSELRGKRIALSPGQAQGSVVYRTLATLGIDPSQVKFVELPATGGTYVNALAANLVDAAPLAGIQIKRYLDQYGKDGGKVLAPYGVKDNPGNLWVLAETLRDPAKAAAIKLYLQAWGRASHWVDTHQAEWIDAYYIKDQGVSPDDAAYIAKSLGNRYFPEDWTDYLKSEQETIDFMAKETGHKSFPAESLFDRRFESVAGRAYADEGLSH
jgi:sulfonate transport system substrate-binding protein